jgi:hypothetical protein
MRGPAFKSKPQRLKPCLLLRLNRHEWNSCPSRWILLSSFSFRENEIGLVCTVQVDRNMLGGDRTGKGMTSSRAKSRWFDRWAFSP